MPPEPSSLDRKDSFKEKRSERPDFLAPSPSRWQDPRRGAPGLCKQGSYQAFPEESGGGRAASFNSAGGAMSTQRSVDDLLVTNTYHANFDVGNSRFDESHFKDQHDKLGGVDGMGTGQVYDKDHSLGSITWKALKWTRSGSLSSRTSGIKSDSGDSRVESLDGKERLLRSSSADPAGGHTSTAPLEESCPRKKPRLGWGQGLAKYEKEKVEGPEQTTGKNGLVHHGSNLKDVNLPDTNAKVASVSVCTSPATLCSVASSSSSGLGDKLHIKFTNSDSDLSHLTNSPGQGFQKCPEELSASVEHLEVNPIKNISSLPVNLLPSQDAISGDNDFVQSTELNRLLLLKADILKSLEKTECEIDLLENELKSLDFNSETDAPCPTPSESLPNVTFLKPCQEEADTTTNLSVRERIPCNDCLEVQAEVKEEDVYSPGTVTSVHDEQPSVGCRISSSDRLKLYDYPADLDTNKFEALGHCSLPFTSMEVSAALCDGEDGNPFSSSSAGTHVPSAVSVYCKAESSVSELIFTSNKELARAAMEVLDKVLTSKPPQVDNGGPDNSISCWKSNLHVQEKLSMHKHLQKIKECVLALKFKAFYHFWKEDLRLLSLRKNRTKSQKRVELSYRSSHSGYKKHRSSSRSRFISPGSSTLVPPTQIGNFTCSKLVSDSQIKHYRNSLKMPALILDQRHSRFITSNGLVEDPCVVEKERKMINPWMADEKEIFMEKLATFGKDFAKIASFLSHKTTADCIEFYYRNHKSESFEKVRKILEYRKQPKCFPANTYMVTSGKKWNRDANAASLDMLGSVSAVASHTDDSENHKIYTGVRIVGHCYEHVVNDSFLGRTSCEGVLRNDSEAAAANVLASICGSVSGEAMNSCVTSPVDPGEALQECAGQKGKSMVMERPFTPEVSENIDEYDAFSDGACGELDSADWTDEEKSSFIMALRIYGKDFTRISKFVRTRSRDQCKIFFSKARKCLGLDLIHQDPENEGTRISDAGGGKSDIEDACVVEMDSGICSTQSCSKTDMDLPPSVPNRSEGSGNSENNRVQMGLDGLSEKNELGGGTNPEVAIGMIELNKGDRSLKEDDDQKGSVPGVLQMDEVTVDSVLGSGNLSVPLTDYADWEARGANEACSYAQVNSISIEVPAELGQSTSHLVVELKQEEQSQYRPYTGVESIQDSKSGSSIEVHIPKSDPIQFQVPDTAPVTGLNDVSVPGRGSDGNNCSTSLLDLADSNGNGESSHQDMEVDGCPSATSIPGDKHEMPFELLSSAQKFHILSCQLKENWPSGLANSSEVHCCEQQGNKQQEASANSDFYQQQLPLQVFRGYPLRLLNKKEMSKHTDLVCEKPVQKLSKINRDSQSSQETCDVSRSPVLVSGLSHLPKSCERLQDLRNVHVVEKQVAVTHETEEQSHRSGDVKLFGQILSHLSPSNKEKNDKAVSSKQSQSITFKFSDVNRMEASSYMGQQEFPVTSFGVWDVNRIHNGLPFLSGSATLSAIHNYPVPKCQLEPRSQSAVLRRNDRVLGRVLGYPTKDASGNDGLAYHQLHQSHGGTNLRPFSIDMERHEHNGVDTMRCQQQGSVLVGMNSVGGGIGLGGCTGMSDPVAVLKKHFANEARSGSGSGCVIREDESCSGGDVCR